MRDVTHRVGDGINVGGSQRTRPIPVTSSNRAYGPFEKKCPIAFLEYPMFFNTDSHCEWDNFYGMGHSNSNGLLEQMP